MVLPLPDKIPHPWRRHQHLARHDPTLAVVGGDEHLGDDALQGVCELRTDLVLLVRWEDVYDPVDGLRGVLGVQRPEDEVPGLRRCYGERDGLEVAHLAYEYHVWVLPQNVLEGLGEALGVLVDLALVNDALLVFVVLNLLTSSGMSPCASSDPSRCARTSRRIRQYIRWCSSASSASRRSGVTCS